MLILIVLLYPVACYSEVRLGLYHSYRASRTVDMISAGTGQLVQTLTLPFTDTANGFAYGDGYVWIYNSYSSSRTVDTISAKTEAILTMGRFNLVLAGSLCLPQHAPAKRVRLRVTSELLGALARDTKKETDLCVPSKAVVR